MPKFRKKPVVVEARQLTSSACWLSWIHDEPFWEGTLLSINGRYHPGEHTIHDAWISIDTLEGVMRASLGDWVIKGVNGEFYPCKPDIFALTYDALEDI
jgi:hypothetical protein